jgi:hypothetical protein
MQGARMEFNRPVFHFPYSRSFIPIVEILLDRVAVSVHSVVVIVLIETCYIKRKKSESVSLQNAMGKLRLTRSLSRTVAIVTSERTVRAKFKRAAASARVAQLPLCRLNDVTAVLLVLNPVLMHIRAKRRLDKVLAPKHLGNDTQVPRPSLQQPQHSSTTTSILSTLAASEPYRPSWLQTRLPCSARRT